MIEVKEYTKYKIALKERKIKVEKFSIKLFFRIEHDFRLSNFLPSFLGYVSSLERWRKAEEAVENRIYEEGNVKATNLFPYQCGIT